MAHYSDNMETVTITDLIDALTNIYDKYGDIEVFAQGGLAGQVLPFRGAAVIRNSDPEYVLLNRPDV